MKLYKYYFGVVLLFLSLNLFGQSPKAFIEAGDKAFRQKDYNAALFYYQEAEKSGNPGALLYYKIAVAATGYFSLELAEASFLKAIEKETGFEKNDTYFKLAEVKSLQSDYSKAMYYYGKFLTKNPGHDLAGSARLRIKDCGQALKMLNTPDSLTVSRLNKRVNTPYSEFAPLLIGDTLYYSSYRFQNKQDETVPKKLLSKVLKSIAGKKGRTLPSKINSKDKLTAHLTMSNDRKRMYFNRCHYTKDGDIRCGIYFSTKDKYNRWAKAKAVPEFVDENFTYTQPHLSVTGKDTLLYFVSDRPGGKGKLDIWSVKITKAHEFGEPRPLDALNTAEDDITPFYHPATDCLYFSSKGYPGLGGFDIYKASRSGEGWSDSEHTGYPLNSSYNDIYFTITQDATLAYLASNRLGSMYLDENNKTCCNDIYKIRFPVKKADTTTIELAIDSLVLVTEINIEQEEALEIEPEPAGEARIPERLEDFLPLALYFDNDEPDKQTRKPTTRKTYGESFKTYYKLKQIYTKEYAIPFNGEKKRQAENDMENFFENELKRNNNFLNLFSEILLSRLKSGEKIEIFVKGFTSPRAESDYNIFLGKRRISSVLNHFYKYENAVFVPYLNNKKLIVTERSFGESTVSENVSDSLEDKRNSIYSIAAAKERRVEIVEIKSSGN